MIFLPVDLDISEEKRKPMDLYLSFGILVYVFFAIVLVYSKLRPKFPVRVYCWFCGGKHCVPFGNRNCWDCPHCDQYNGFSETGDYNKPIPAQFDEGLNFPVTGSVAEGYEEKYKQPLINGLCKECNQNQTMKIRLLSDFVPLNKLCFVQEVEAYQSHLEKVYKLCWQCEVQVQKKLSQQDAELRPKIPPHLLYYRLNEHTKPVLKVLTRNDIPFGVHVLAAVNFSSALLLFVSAIFELQEDRGCRIFPISWLMVSRLPTSSFLTVVGLLVAVGGTLWAGRQRLRTVDALCCALWVTLQGLYSSVVSGLFTEPDLHLLRPTVILVTAMVSFSSGIFRMPKMVNPKQKWLNKANQLTSSRRKIKVLNRSSCGHKSMDNLSQSFGTKQASQSFTNSSCSFRTDGNITPHHSLHLELDALHITSPGSLASKLQVYSASPRPVGFSASKHQTSLVRPARFTAKSVTQASWVAGGYWSLPVPPVRMEHEFGRGLHFNSSVPSGFGGLLTPPPSLSGSQESRAPSPSGSVCGDDLRFESVNGRSFSRSSPSVLSWPPSVAREQWQQNLHEVRRRNVSSKGSSSGSSGLQKTDSDKPGKKEVSSTEQNSLNCQGKRSLTLGGHYYRCLVAVSVALNFCLVGYFVVLPYISSTY